MDDQVTPDEVWRLFKATDEKLDRSIEAGNRRYAEFLDAMERSRARTDSEFEKVSRQIADVNRQIGEVDGQISDVNQQIADVNQQVAEVNGQIAEVNGEVRALTREMRALTRKMGDLTDRIGEFAEGMVIPALRSLLARRGIDVVRVHRHVQAGSGDKTTEFDVLLFDGPTVVAVEIKSRLKVSDVTDHLDRMGHFKAYFPEYQDRAAIGVVAGMVVDEDAAKYAYRQGLFVLGQSGETVRILNDERFTPKEW